LTYDGINSPDAKRGVKTDGTEKAATTAVLAELIATGKLEIPIANVYLLSQVPKVQGTGGTHAAKLCWCREGGYRLNPLVLRRQWYYVVLSQNQD